MGRVSKQEMGESINKPKTAERAKVTKTTLFDKAGIEVDILPEDQISAKVVDCGGNCRFFIKADLSGQPVDYYDRSFIDDAYRQARNKGRSPYEFLEVPKNNFELYLKYLSNGNKALLNAAKKGL
jgi:hypothetical protein